MNEEFGFNIALLIKAVAEVIVIIATTCVAFAAVNAAIAGVVGTLLAYCAAVGASNLALCAWKLSVEGIETSAKYVAYRVERIKARRRNDRFFSTINA